MSLEAGGWAREDVRFGHKRQETRLWLVLTFNPGYYTKLPALALLYEHTARILVCGTYPELITVEMGDEEGNAGDKVHSQVQHQEQDDRHQK